MMMAHLQWLVLGDGRNEWSEAAAGGRLHHSLRSEAQLGWGGQLDGGGGGC